MQPNIHLNYVAVIIAVIAHFILGFLWYTPLFGKIWAKELGLKMDQKPPASLLIRGMLFNLVGNFFLAFVLSHNMAAWNPLSWGQAPSEMSPAQNAFMAAIFTWLGF